MSRDSIIQMVMDECATYNCLMSTDGVSNYGKGHFDGLIWTLEKIGVIVTPQRCNGLCCNPIEKVTIYFRDEDYITTYDVMKSKIKF